MTQLQPSRSLVLYADDDPDDIELVRQAFDAYTSHIRLETFGNGAELLSYLAGLQELEPLPCLLILDINMPRVNGKEALRYIRLESRFREIPVVLFTTSTLPSEAAFAASFDAGFITKPLHADHISLLVDEMIRHCSDDVQKLVRQSRENNSRP